jgi:hypothetical protein
LHSIRGRQLFGGFVLDHHALVHDHIEALPGDMLALVADVHHQLSNDPVAPSSELVLECTGVHALAQAITIVVVHREEAADDRMHSLGLEELATHTVNLTRKPPGT